MTTCNECTDGPCGDFARNCEQRAEGQKNMVRDGEEWTYSWTRDEMPTVTSYEPLPGWRALRWRLLGKLFRRFDWERRGCKAVEYGFIGG